MVAVAAEVCAGHLCVCKYPRVLALCSVSRDQNSQKRWCLGFNTEGDRENVEVWRRRWRGKNSVVQIHVLSFSSVNRSVTTNIPQ